MTSSHQWRFCLTAQEAWDAMYRDCAEAEQSIEMEEYIIENDPAGRRFLELFIEKASAGISVFVICDRYGSYGLLKSPLVDKLRQAGGRFYFYHEIGFLDIFRPWRLFPRTHVKTLLVDSRIAYTGSVCIAERMKDWRDTQIKVTGPVVAQFKDSFSVPEKNFTLARQKCAPLSDRKAEFAYVQSNPVFCRCLIYVELVRAIKEAQRSLYITTPFFAPNIHFRSLLRRKSRKGVHVVLLIPLRSDVLVADWMMLSYAKSLLKAGVKIYRYQNVPVHSKTIVADDSWATIGSTNIDVLSFFNNREANLIIRNAKAIAEMKQHFLDDLANSRELTLEELAKEPIYKAVIGRLARYAKHFLK